MSEERIPLEASRPARAAGLRKSADPPPSQPVQATLLLRRRAAGVEARVDAIMRGEAAPMSRNEAAQTMGADPQDIQKAADFAESHGLTVTESSPAQRSLKISGTVAQMEDAFGVRLLQGQSGNESYLYYDEPITLPASLAGVIEGVLGLDQRPVAESR